MCECGSYACVHMDVHACVYTHRLKEIIGFPLSFGALFYWFRVPLQTRSSLFWGARLESSEPQSSSYLCFFKCLGLGTCVGCTARHMDSGSWTPVLMLESKCSQPLSQLFSLHLTFFKLKFLFYYFICMVVLPECMFCVPHVCLVSTENRRGCQIPWKWSYRQLWGTM